MITVVDYGMGNTGSILNMYRKLGVPARVATSAGELTGSTRIILPGVGSFDHGMDGLRQGGFVEALGDLVLRNRVPVLGICLGMQLLATASEEGASPGLGWVDAKVVRFRPDPGSRLRVPHMGWDQVHFQGPHPLATPLSSTASRFYFVHAYHMVCSDPFDVLCTSDFGGSFVAGIARGGIVGVQFHPEKSHQFGMRLLSEFAKFSP